MKYFAAIFNKPVILPGDKLEKIKTYGLLFEKTDKATFERMEKYIKEYILAVAQLFKEGIEHIDEWTYKKNGEEFYVDGPTWGEYIKKAEKAKVRFAIIDDENIEITDDDLYDNYLLTNKEKWEELKAMKNIVWH